MLLTSDIGEVAKALEANHAVAVVRGKLFSSRAHSWPLIVGMNLIEN